MSCIFYLYVFAHFIKHHVSKENIQYQLGSLKVAGSRDRVSTIEVTMSYLSYLLKTVIDVIFRSFILKLVKYYIWTAGVSIAIVGVVMLGCQCKKGPLAKYNYHFKFIAVVFSLFGSSMVMWPIYLLKPMNVINFRYTNWFTTIVTSALDVTIEFRESRILQEDRGAVICLNHQSSLDVIFLLMLAPIAKKIAPIAKKIYLCLVPFSQITCLAGLKFIDRSSPSSAYQTLKDLSRLMTKDKVKLILFPEGTRNRGRGMLTFKRGAFKTAIMGQVPIIPIVISPYYFIDHKKKEFNKGHVICKALDPIPTKGMTDADHEELMERTRTAMLAEYERLAAEVDEKSLQKEWRDKERPQIFVK